MDFEKSRGGKKKKKKNAKKPPKVVTNTPSKTLVVTTPRGQKILQLLLKTVADLRLLWVAKGNLPSTFKLKRDDIPFWDALFGKGTQIPTIRLRYKTSDISITAATAYSTVYALSLDQFLNYTDLVAVFDEYRPVRGEFRYMPVQTTGPAGVLRTMTDSLMVAVIDYTDTTALTTVDSGAAYDTHKFFHCASVVGVAKFINWPVLFDWVPDEEWLTTATVNSSFASWKPYLPSTHGATTALVGKLTGWCDFQFRLAD